MTSPTTQNFQPPQWHICSGDVLDIKADVLICSANVQLTLSGGVGGALLQRYGDHVQQALRDVLTQRGSHFVEQGEVIATRPDGTPFRAILHAVAVDGFYDSSPLVIESVVEKALQIASNLGARTVALPAIATGYGRLTIEQFAQGVRPLMQGTRPPLTSVTICLRHSHQAGIVRTVCGTTSGVDR